MIGAIDSIPAGLQIWFQLWVYKIILHPIWPPKPKPILCYIIYINLGAIFYIFLKNSLFSDLLPFLRSNLFQIYPLVRNIFNTIRSIFNTVGTHEEYIWKIKIKRINQTFLEYTDNYPKNLNLYLQNLDIRKHDNKLLLYTESLWLQVVSRRRFWNAHLTIHKLVSNHSLSETWCSF